MVLGRNGLGVFHYIRKGRGNLLQRESLWMSRPRYELQQRQSCGRGATADGISTSIPFPAGEKLLSEPMGLIELF